MYVGSGSKIDMIVTSQIFNLECYTLDHHCISYFIAFLVDPRNSTQLKDPRRELGISLFSYLSFLKNLKIGSFDFIYFIFNYFYYKNMRGDNMTSPK